MPVQESHPLQSIEYGYLEELIRGYRSRYQNRSQRIYLICKAWSYTKDYPPNWSYSGYQSGFYLEKQPDGELHLKSNKGKSGVFARWMPNDEVVVITPRPVMYILGHFFQRKDGFEIKPGDRYSKGVPPDLVPLDQLQALDQRAIQLANYLLPPQVEFCYLCDVDNEGNPHFRLRLYRVYNHSHSQWEIPKTEPGYRKTFQTEMLKVCQERQITMPRRRGFEFFRARGRTAMSEILGLLAS